MTFCISGVQVGDKKKKSEVSINEK